MNKKPGLAPVRRRGLALLLVCLLLAALMPAPVRAWGAVGHQAIAALAQRELTPQARQRVDALLALEPGASLASISNWADEHKNPTTARWHFMNFPRDSCVYARERDCPDGNCLLAAIARQLEVLGSAAAPDRKLLALKYLVHLVGDIHQPLHLGYLDDRGGNQYQIQFYKRGSNLHSLWDSGLIKTVSDDAGFWVERLAALPPPPQARVIDPVALAEESCRIVAMPGFYPERRVEGPYVARFGPLVEQQLRLAAARLARMLDALGPSLGP